MAVHYKFKSTKDFHSITVDGGFISVGDLRRAIIDQQRLKKVADHIQLLVYNSQTNEEYEDASTLIPRNTSVIIKRLPARRNAYQPYLARNAANTDVEQISMPVRTAAQGEGEEERILDIVNKAAGWERTVASSNYSASARAPRNQEARIPPPTYICHRCNEPGHYIVNCPTNGDDSFDYRKVKKATGIPRAFLKSVDCIKNEMELIQGGNGILTSGQGGQGAGALLLPGGGFAVMTPNTAAFERANQTLGVMFQQNRREASSTPDTYMPPSGNRIQTYISGREDAKEPSNAASVGTKRSRSSSSHSSRRNDVMCYSCGEKGHMARECPSAGRMC